MGRTLREVLPANAAHACYSALQEALGQPRIFHNVVAPIRVEDRIVGYNQDITERKQTEQQIRNLAFYDSLT